VLSSHHEGLSLSSLEGMASGRPFIASNVPGLKEIVEGYGFLFEKGDSKVLSDLVKKFIADTGFSNEVSKKCVSRAKMFNIKLMVDKYIKLYKEAVYGI